jgi:hypothetical protein
MNLIIGHFALRERIEKSQLRSDSALRPINPVLSICFLILSSIFTNSKDSQIAAKIGLFSFHPKPLYAPVWAEGESARTETGPLAIQPAELAAVGFKGGAEPSISHSLNGRLRITDNRKDYAAALTTSASKVEHKD